MSQEFKIEPGENAKTTQPSPTVVIQNLPSDEKLEQSKFDSENQVYEVHRGLKQRHISMIAIGGTIGTGLFLGSGQALRQAGPVGTLIGYVLMGVVVYSMQVSLGEMVTMFPVTGAIPHYAERFFDPAMGFAVGFNICYATAIGLATEITAAAIVIQYWDDTTPSWVFLLCFLLSIWAINLTGVRWYGEVEFVFSAIKVLVIIGLIILGIILDLGGGPTQDRIGFRYWIDPGPFTQFHGISGATGRFLGFWTVFNQAAYSYLGVEIVATSAGEAENPRKTIPKAIKRVFYRILLFYVGGIMVIGLLVPSNAAGLFSTKGKGTANTSPFVIAINNAGIGVLPDIVNAVILVSAYSAGNTSLYTGSRVLHGLAVRGMAPKIFSRCTKSGKPLYALIPTAAGGLFAFLRLNHSGATVFSWLSRISSMTGLVTWFTILLSYARFYQGLKYHGIDRNKIPYKSPLQPYLSYFGLGMLILVIIFSGFEVFLKDNWSTANFITSYIILIAYVILYIYWKVTKRSKIVTIIEMDFFTVTKQLEDMDTFYAQNAYKPNTRFKKIWDWIF